MRRLEGALGVVVRVEGLSRVETQTLAALARAPRGLTSARAVARRAGVSPTAASKAIAALMGRGLVRRDREWVAAGRARSVDVIRASVMAPDWHRLAPALAQVRLPMGPAPERPTRIPDRLAHLFWDADPHQLAPGVHGAYVADRLISTGDLDGLAWGRDVLTSADWLKAARDRGLTARERALALNLARSTRP
jgi:DNA-binding Lrp family transcriptional regulator